MEEKLVDKIKRFLTINNGSGYGSGDGSGDGSGSGSGYGDGYGSGDVDGDGITIFNGLNVNIIDNIQTIITNVKNDIAKGFILKRDFTTDSCYIAKGHNKFAHGKTVREAVNALEEKIFEELDVEEALEEFCKKFEKNKKYKGEEFYKWHHILTGSCEMGRNTFVKNNEIDLNELFTVNEFIKACENDYGGEIIKRLKEFY